MKTALSLNDCARQLGDHPRGVRSPRFDLFVDFTRPERSKGRVGQAIYSIPDACLGQPLPDTRQIFLLIAPRRSDGGSVNARFSAS